MNTAKLIFITLCIAAGLALLSIIYNYYKGLKQSPRDLWLLFAYKFVEYSAYAAMNSCMVLWLSKDCGLGDIEAGTFISYWSIGLSAIGMLAGSLVDAIGIRKTMIISVVFLILARIAFAFITTPWVVLISGFIPLAIGFAIVAPVISVAIKRYTTKESCAIGFGLFYVIMNLGYAVGGFFLDFARSHFASRDTSGKIINENFGLTLLGHHFSTYQIIFIVGVIATMVSLLITFFIRDGIELNDDGELITTPQTQSKSLIDAITTGAIDTAKLIQQTFTEKFFWVYMGLLSMTLFVRFVFFHFHYTFPKYGIRVLGEGAKIGTIYGVLNPVLILFLVPIVAFLTKKTSSYKMMIIGSLISSLSCFIACLPPQWFNGLTDSLLGEIIFINCLNMAPDHASLLASPPVAEYWTLMIFITVFTIGEAIWSPRLMQFTAEIAPKGKEGTYIALSVLPYFVAKFFVGPMSGLLLKSYTPLDENQQALASYPNHHMIWLWIGAMAVISPIGLLLFRSWFIKNTSPPPSAIEN